MNKQVEKIKKHFEERLDVVEDLRKEYPKSVERHTWDVLWCEYKIILSMIDKISEGEKEEVYKKNIEDIFSKYTVDGVLTPSLEMCKELAYNDFLQHPEKLGIEPCDISTMTSNIDEYNRIIDTYAMGLAKGMSLVIEEKEGNPSTSNIEPPSFEQSQGENINIHHLIHGH